MKYHCLSSENTDLKLTDTTLAWLNTSCQCEANFDVTALFLHRVFEQKSTNALKICIAFAGSMNRALVMIFLLKLKKTATHLCKKVLLFLDLLIHQCSSFIYLLLLLLASLDWVWHFRIQRNLESHHKKRNLSNWALKAQLDTFGNCQRPIFSLGVSQ